MTVTDQDRPASFTRLAWLPLLTGLLPIVAIHASLFLAIWAGVIPACIPYLDGCASISATGRYEPAVYLFKPAMTIESVLMVAYWFVAVAWLEHLYKLAALPRIGIRTIAWLGSAGALALVIYVTFLGTQTPFYEFMRRFGVYLYFLFSVLAQIALAWKARRAAINLQLQVSAAICRIQLWLALVPFALGALNLILKAVLVNADASENIIEWIFALLMHIYFVLSYFSWRETGIGIATRLALNRQG